MENKTKKPALRKKVETRDGGAVEEEVKTKQKVEEKGSDTK